MSTRRNMIILCNCLADLRETVALAPGRLRYLCLLTTEEGARIEAFLREHGALDERVNGGLVDERREDFRRRYIEFIASLNEANCSKFWWALPLTTKSPLPTALCRDTFSFLLITELASRESSPLVVVTESEDLAAQVHTWGRGEGMRVISRIRSSRPWWRRFLRRTPAPLALAVCRLGWRWLKVRRYAPERGWSPTLALTSLVHGHSFTADRYRDAYFGTLVDFLAERRARGLVFAMLMEGGGESLVARLASRQSPLPVVPVEACLSLLELLRCVLHGVVRYLWPFRLLGSTTIDGRDLRVLLERSIRSACRDGTFLMHLRMYYCGRSLARRVVLERCVYPFENRAFERMLVTGVREASPSTRIVAYNHASVTRGHTHLILGRHEAKIVPLPDVILTVGPIVSDWLEAEGRYPPGMFRPGCALRQGWTEVPLLQPRRVPIRDVLVALATSLEEYARTLRFIEAAFRETGTYRVRVRPHPEFRLEDGLRVAGVKNRECFEEDHVPLGASLEQADVVLYASSTVGLEAVARGIPAIYLDFGDFLDTDPMIGWSEFKWTAREPASLVPILRGIDAIPDGQFRGLQEKAHAYATRYLAPVTEAALEAFLAA